MSARRRLLVASMSLAFTLVAGLYSVVVPEWEAPDEPAHFAYVAYLLDRGGLPRMEEGAGPTEANQPPLYYLLAAALVAPVDRTDPAGAFEPNPRFIWAGQGGREPNVAVHGTASTYPYAGQALALHVARLASVLAGAATVGLVVLLGLELLPRRPSVALLAGGLAAFNPQFAFAGGALGNDVLTALLSSATALAVLRAARAPERARGWAVVGVLVGLALLTKLTAAFLLPVAGLAALGLALHRRSGRLAWRGALALGVPIVALTGWWFARNQVLYGDPFGQVVFQRIHAWNQRFAPVTADDVARFADKTFRSFWGTFGWMTLGMPEWTYAVFLGLSALGVLWFVPALLLWRGSRLGGRQVLGLGWLAAFVLAQAGLAGAIALRCGESCYQGRYLFGAIAPIALLIAFAALALLPERLARGLAVLSVGLLFANALWVLDRDIRPRYQLAMLSKTQAAAAPDNVDATVGADVRLLGYELTDRRSDGAVVVTLYWRALSRPRLDYSAFVHLIDRDGNILAQKDQMPGEASGRRPTTWTAGDVVRDRHTIAVPPDLESFRLRVGLYDAATGQQLPIVRNGRSAGTYLILTPPTDGIGVGEAARPPSLALAPPPASNS